MEPRLAAGYGSALNGVIWITGLAGAGKTSIARALVAQLRAAGQPCVLLDGDELRSVFGETRHDRASRLSVAHGISRLATLIAEQHLIAVVATISLFHEIHAINRSSSTPYLEVVVQCPLAALRERRTIYNGPDGDDVVGLGIPAEFPVSPHVVIDNAGSDARFDDHAASIIDAWNRHVGL